MRALPSVLLAAAVALGATIGSEDTLVPIGPAVDDVTAGAEVSPGSLAPALARDPLPVVGFASLRDRRSRSVTLEPVRPMLRGRVVDEDGQPLCGATVSLAASFQQTTSNSDGGFELAVPDRETWLVRAVKTGYALAELPVRARDRAHALASVCVTLVREASIRGRVSGAGPQAPRIWVERAQHPLFGLRGPSVSADADPGMTTFCFIGLAPGTCRVCAIAPAMALRVSARIRLRAGTEVCGLDLRLVPESVVCGEVRWTDGRFVGRGRVRLVCRAAPDGTGGFVQTWTRPSDTGEFRFAGLPDGDYEVSFASRMSLCASMQVFAVRRGEIRRVTIPVRRGAILEGIVRDESGRPVGGRVVVLRGDDGNRRTRSDDAGCYRFVGLPPGDYVIGSLPVSIVGGVKRYQDLLVARDVR